MRIEMQPSRGPLNSRGLFVLTWEDPLGFRTTLFGDTEMPDRYIISYLSGTN